MSVCKFSHSLDVSICNLSPNFSCFISTNMFPHIAVVYETWSCACSHTKKDWCLHTCWLTKTCLCVTFNISHRVFHLWPTWNDVRPHDVNLQNLLSMQILTYETMPEDIDLTNTKAVRRVHCKHLYLYETFWHTETCLYTTFDTRVHVFVQFLTYILL